MIPKILTSIEALFQVIFPLTKQKELILRDFASLDALCGRVLDVKLSPVRGRTGVSPVMKIRDSTHLQDDYNRDLIASVLQEKGRNASSKDYSAIKKALERGASYQYLKAMVDALPITSNLMGL